MPTTPERDEYHRRLLGLTGRLAADAVVFDVGKHRRHDYASWFPAPRRYVSIDRDATVKPNIVLDLEVSSWVGKGADAILVNGVTEVCGNPFRLARGAFELVKPGSLALWGIMSVAYPIYETDFARFTPAGARRLVESAGFRVIEATSVERGGVPSYCYLLCERPA